jgi:hypothetical protein
MPRLLFLHCLSLWAYSIHSVEALPPDIEHDGCLSKRIRAVCQDIELFCYSAGTLTELIIFHEDHKKDSTASLDWIRDTLTRLDLNVLISPRLESCAPLHSSRFVSTWLFLFLLDLNRVIQLTRLDSSRLDCSYFSSTWIVCPTSLVSIRLDLIRPALNRAVWKKV